MTLKDEIKRLVDSLPDEEATIVLAFLRERMEDPDHLMPTEEEAVRSGREAFQQGETVSLSQVRADLGL